MSLWPALETQVLESRILPRAPRFTTAVASLMIAGWLAPVGSASGQGLQPQPDLLTTRTLASGQSARLTFSASTPRSSECLALELDARLQAVTFSGSTLALAITLDGHVLGEERILDKPLVYAQTNSVLSTWADSGLWRVVYSPDMDPRRNATAQEHQVLGVNPYHLVLRIDDLATPGDHVLVLTHAGPQLPSMEVAHVRLAFRPCTAAAAKAAAVATAPLAAVVTTGAAPAPRFTLQPDGTIESTAGEFVSWIDTQVSVPRGGWRRLDSAHAGWKTLQTTPGGLRAQATDLALDRRVSVSGAAVEVHDTLVNRTSTDLGVQVRYRIRNSTSTAAAYLGGIRAPEVPLALSRYEPQAPSAVLIEAAGAIGVLPANDVMWIQSESFRDSTGTGLQDRQICIAPGDSVALAFHILPLPHGTYSDWLNAARALLGANFTIDGGFAFGSFAMTSWPVEKLRDWIATRHLHFLATPGPTASSSTGVHGPAVLRSPQALTMLQQFAAAVHRATPDVKVLAYFHCYLVNNDAMVPGYQNERVLAQDLSPVFYPYPSNPRGFQLCVPRQGSAFAADLETLLAKLWDFGYDGVYWDELAYSFKPWTYGPTWDGASGDLDPASHLLLRKKSAIPLLAEPWIEAQLDRMIGAGKVVVANTEPVTASMHKYRFPRFVETRNTMQLASTQLWSPIGLGDRTREKDDGGVAGRIQVHLEHGAVYYYYSPAVSVGAPNLTAWMFPITPVLIRDGTILGQERILTSRSGTFGWEDDSQHEVHLFDAAGREIPTPVSTQTPDGKTWTKLELQAGQTAAIVRHPR